MTELNVEHVLMLAIVAFVLYHFMGRCSCDRFNVGVATRRPRDPEFIIGNTNWCVGIMGCGSTRDIDSDYCKSCLK